MGAQQTKDRIPPAGPSVAKSTRTKPRTKDSKTLGSNIFTEHSGQFIHLLSLIIYMILVLRRKYFNLLNFKVIITSE